MSQHNKINDYIKTVCEQIRWKKAHPSVTKELTDHITDQKNAYIKQGMDESAAEAEAVRQMGDPVTVGTQLDGTYRPKPNWSIIIFAIALLLLGTAVKLIVNINEIPYYSPRDFNSIIITILIGIAIFTGGVFLDFTILEKYAKLIYFSFIVVLIVLRYTYLSYEISKMLTLLFPVIYAGVIYQHRGKRYLGLLSCGFYFFIPAYLCFSSLSMLIMVSLVCVIMLTYAILKGWFNINKAVGLLIIYIVPLPLIGLVIYHNLHYGIETSDYYLKMARDIVYNAKLIGSSSRSLFIPNIHNLKTNYPLAYLIYEYGWISLIGITAALTAFVSIAFLQIKKLKGLLGKLTSHAVLLTLTVQILFSILRNLGLLPAYAATLPFFSFNSTSIVINMFLVGIMLSVFKTGNLIGDCPLPALAAEKRKTLELINGRVTINIYRK